MFKKICAGLILILATALFTAPGAFGATDAVVLIDRDEGRITISGSVGTPHQIVTLLVFRPSKSAQDFEVHNPKSAVGVLDYLGQTKADGEGRFSFSYISVGPSGEYHYSVGEAAASGVYTPEEKFYFANAKEVQVVFDTINSAKSSAEFYARISKSYKMLDLDMSDFSALPKSEQEKVVSCLLNIRDASAAGKFENTAALVQGFEDARFVQKVNTSSESALQALLESRQGAWEVYATLSAEGKKWVVKRISESREFADHASLQTVFKQSTLLYTLFPLHWSHINAFLTDNNDVLKLNLSAYTAQKDTSATDKKIAGVLYTSTAKLQAAINNSFSQDTGSGGGGGNMYYTPSLDLTDNGNTYTPAPEEAAQNDVFKDIGETPWAATEIIALYNMGVVNGRDKEHFAPNDLITREEFVKLIVCALNIPIYKDDADFDDTESGAWYSPYIAAAVRAGLIRGVSDKFFGVGLPIIRQDMAVIIYRANDLYSFLSEYGVIAEEFADTGHISDYALEAVMTLQAEGIINGMGDGRFAPREAVTRAQAAVIIYRVIQNTEKETPASQTETSVPLSPEELEDTFEAEEPEQNSESEEEYDENNEYEYE